MEEKRKKKKLTLSVSTKKPYQVSNYRRKDNKTSVVIEKKIGRRGNEKDFIIGILVKLNQSQKYLVILFRNVQL